ncbi:MAG: N-acetylmuramoyl-L-alanine amidase [Elusimicrobiota bacterium]
MRNTKFLPAILTIWLWPLQTQADEPVLVRPLEGETIPIGAAGIIAAGHVEPGIKWVWINGMKVPVYWTGSFSSYVPSDALAKNNWTVTLATTVRAAAAAARTVRLERPKAMNLKERITSSLEPKASSLEILPSESLGISFQAAPGGRAWYRIASIAAKSPMNETLPGFYEGRFAPAPQDTFRRSKSGELEIFFEGQESLRLKTGKNIRVAQPGAWPKAFETTATKTKILSSPQSGNYWFSVPSGTILSADGTIGNFHRVRLGGALKGWVAADELKAEKYLSAVPKVISVRVVESTAPDNETVLKILWNSNAQLPFLVEEQAERELKIRLFNCRIHLNWIPFKPSAQSSVVEGISWNIPMEDEVDLNVALSRPLGWGYWSQSFKGGLAIRFRKHGKRPLANHKNRAPRADDNSASSEELVAKKISGKQMASPYRLWLEGLTVAIDPGHGGRESGALAPSGHFEHEANLRLAKELARHLENRGAKTVLTRQSADETLSLEKRVEIARAVNPDFFISIHCNDFASWINPYEGGPWGHSVYYYRQLSIPLAQRIKKALRERRNLSLPDNGVLWGDLYILRELTVPAVLIEVGYLVFPWQEEMLLWDKNFSSNFSETVSRALETHAKEMANPLIGGMR